MAAPRQALATRVARYRICRSIGNSRAERRHADRSVEGVSLGFAEGRAANQANSCMADALDGAGH